MSQVAFLGDFQIASSGSPTTLVDLTAYVKSAKIGRGAEMFDVTNLGEYAKKFLKGLTEATLDVEFFYHATPFTQLQNLLDYHSGGVSWQLGPEGSATGKVKMSQVGTLNTGTNVGAVVEKVDDATDVGQVKMMSCSFKISGAITFGTYA